MDSEKLLGKVVLVIVVAAVLAIVMAFPVMLLWNWIMPIIFGLPLIDFWEALGITLLCGILFKSSSSSSSS